MELRHLRYFVAVAEELHFTRAAERLGIKQPPLSLQIRKLEAELGAPLFRRLTRGIELTEPGALLLSEARRLLGEVERVKAGVQSLARGETGRIHVGFAGATYSAPVVPAIIRRYRERHSAVQLSPLQSNTPFLVSALRGGEVDVAFIRPPISDSEGLGLLPVFEEPMMIAAPTAHPLAARGSAALRDLEGETLILFPREIGPGLHDAIIAACQTAGFSPNLGQAAPQLPSIVYMVAAGFGVSIVPRSIEQIKAAGVRYLPIDGEAPKAVVSLAYRRDDHSPVVRHFVDLARKMVRS